MSFSRNQPNTSTESPELLPQRKNLARVRIVLCVLSGAMLGLSFPPSSVGVLACFGLVPLLIVLADIQETRVALRYVYLAMVVFHLITLNWTGGYSHANDPYMMIAGAITMLLHPFFYFIPLFGYLFVRQHVGDKAALVALPFFWVGYEYSHSLSEWSFPWLTIGNSQTYDLARIQFISATGVYGLSLWILVLNVVAFVLYSGLAQERFKPISGRSAVLVGVFLAVYYLPTVHGSLVLSTASTTEDPLPANSQNLITVGIIQSNVDPWEKWRQRGHGLVELYWQLTRTLFHDHPNQKPDLILWPETALPYDILAETSRPVREEFHRQVNEISASILTGLPHAVYYSDSTKAPPSAKRSRNTGEFYDVYNAAALIQPEVSEIPWYGKMKMVPLAERVPYADAFYFLDFLRWNVGIGGWQIGPDSVIFVDRKTGTRFCVMICYESTYPAFVAGFVKKGAEFISVITIDSWWGRMSGAFQHQQFAILRAVENRRWIARCAVGGMSCYIDPYGRVYDKTELFTQATLLRTIGRRSDLTFYSEHGDLLAQGCLLVAGLFFAAGVGRKFMDMKRSQLWKTSALT